MPESEPKQSNTVVVLLIIIVALIAGDLLFRIVPHLCGSCRSDEPSDPVTADGLDQSIKAVAAGLTSIKGLTDAITKLAPGDEGGDGLLGRIAASLESIEGKLGHRAADGAATKSTTDIICGTEGSCAQATVNIDASGAFSPEDGDRSENGTDKIWMSVFFSPIGSADDQGITAQDIAPRLFKFVGGREDCYIFVEGHADSVGPDSRNRELAKRRAANVVESLQGYFEAHGSSLLDGTKDEQRPQGERDLIHWTRDGVSDQINRRADIFVTCG